MKPSAQLVDLLRDLRARRMDRPALARWLAQHSIHFLESTSEADRVIVADLDAALGEVQAGRAGEPHLSSVASELAAKFDLDASQVILT